MLVEDYLPNIAVLIDVYNPCGGATMVATDYVKRLKSQGVNAFLVARDVANENDCSSDLSIVGGRKSICQFLNKHQIDVIHYFKSEKKIYRRSLFMRFSIAARMQNRKIFSLMTICQKPSNGLSILTPNEIKNTDYFVFIDKTAYNDPLYSFIPRGMKTWMYLSSTKQMIKESGCEQFVKNNYELNNANIITYGRGSTLNKCPKDVLEIFDRIRTDHKKRFLIVGMPEYPNWLKKKIEKRKGDDIQTFPSQKLIDYARLVGSFDVMLYYIPNNAHSSIDGSLTMALRLGVPVVVYGPEAPKESIVHGENGFIANTKEEIIKYAEMLGSDKELRAKIGRKARRMFVEGAPDIHWSEKHFQIIRKMWKNERKVKFKIGIVRRTQIYWIKYTAETGHLVSRLYQSVYRPLNNY